MTTSRFIQYTSTALDVNEWVEWVASSFYDVIDNQLIYLTSPTEEWTDIRVTSGQPNLWGYRPFDCDDAEWLEPS